MLPLLPQPSAALLSQMATHAVRPLSPGDPRGTMITSLSEAVVLSTDVVAEGKVTESILRQPAGARSIGRLQI